MIRPFYNTAGSGTVSASNAGRRAHVIVVGNEKGGTGKSTTATHTAVALLHAGFEVGIIDLDMRQRSFTRYMENRLAWSTRHNTTLLMPRYAKITLSPLGSEAAAVRHAVSRLSTADYIVIDCPGSDSAYSRAAHALADTIVTPMNDSFIDFDLLAYVDPETFEIAAPSIYSEMIWESRKLRARADGGKIDWVVVRNRTAGLGNGHHIGQRERIAHLLDSLSHRYGFRTAPGLSERNIYKELFLSGLTLLDLTDNTSHIDVSLAHLAARQEIRNLMAFLQLPNYNRANKAAQSVHTL
jgi:chromosome partitioning protein